jgi:hypothetical protein
MNLIQEIRAKQVLEEENLNLPIKIVHKETPITIIGDKKFNLIFPKFILNYRKQKDIETLFVGFKNKKRTEFLNKFKNATIIYSNRGRNLNTKIKDEEYFNLIGRAKFVLCPNGDFIWTYRFFESILLGAIPIIQDYSDLYKNYKFYKYGDEFEYKSDWIEFNTHKIKKEMMWNN